jgi:nitrite reductase/ring-hydroxylating ferredoxin subunit/uncharacterized membrane protein
MIERQGWLEPLEQSIGKAVGKAYDSMGDPGRQVKDFLHGTWLGHPLHSAITDVPVGAWTAALVFDLLDERAHGRAADTAIAVGLAGAVAAAAAGVTDWHVTEGRAKRIGLVHGMMNLTVAGLYSASLLMRRAKRRDSGRGLAFAGYALAMASAYLGGKLVYSEKVGVDHSSSQDQPQDFVPVLPEAELGENRLHRVEVQGNRILLVRRGERVFAIGEVCAHLGGPLAEGPLDGDVVECPWHRSRYSIEDGALVEGPSVHPQPCYEVRVRSGQIEVRVSSKAGE